MREEQELKFKKLIDLLVESSHRRGREDIRISPTDYIGIDNGKLRLQAKGFMEERKVYEMRFGVEGTAITLIHVDHIDYAKVVGTMIEVAIEQGYQAAQVFMPSNREQDVLHALGFTPLASSHNVIWSTDI